MVLMPVKQDGLHFKISHLLSYQTFIVRKYDTLDYELTKVVNAKCGFKSIFCDTVLV